MRPILIVSTILAFMLFSALTPYQAQADCTTIVIKNSRPCAVTLEIETTCSTFTVTIGANQTVGVIEPGCCVVAARLAETPDCPVNIIGISLDGCTIVVAYSDTL